MVGTTSGDPSLTTSSSEILACSSERWSPSASFPYLQERSSGDGLRPTLIDGVGTADAVVVAPSATQSAAARRPNKLLAFFQLNAVQRCVSAAILAPLVTIFIWQSPAFATATVCSFMTSACSYEYACIANRIQLRIVTKLDAFERAGDDVASSVGERNESATSPHSTRSNDSATGEHDARASRSHVRVSESPSVLRDRALLQPLQSTDRSAPWMPIDPDVAGRSSASSNDDSDVDIDAQAFRGLEAQLAECAVTGLAKHWFCGQTWLAAAVVSACLSAVASLVFLTSASLIPQLQSTEFYESRVFYTVTTDFVAALCACYSPNWRYAVIGFVENAVFTILTMHSTICPINQFSCGLSVEPAQVFLSGAVVVLCFRFATSRSGPHAFVLFLLDMLGYVYIIGSLSVLVAFVDDDKKTLYRKLLIALLYVVWASDTGAYLTGKVLAGLAYPKYNPLAAHLSKNKDYEGTLGAIVFGVAAMMIASHLLSVPGSTGTKVAFTVLGVVVGRLGDLFESLLKRAAGVKDSGKLIPGHGGVLDRIDALMFAALVFARYYAMVIGVDWNEQRR